jgi:hypothetical protein
MVNMPNIKPISDLRNYTDVLKQVDVSKRVYLTRNGHGEYGILTMEEIDELDRYRAAYQLITKLKKSEERANVEGWISSEEVEKELEVLK